MDLTLSLKINLMDIASYFSGSPFDDREKCEKGIQLKRILKYQAEIFTKNQILGAPKLYNY